MGNSNSDDTPNAKKPAKVIAPPGAENMLAAVSAVAKAAAQHALEMHQANLKRDEEFFKLPIEEQLKLQGTNKPPDPAKYAPLAEASAHRKMVNGKMVEITGSFDVWKSDSDTRGIQAQLSKEGQDFLAKTLTQELVKKIAWIGSLLGAAFLGLEHLVKWLEAAK